jgi:6-phosphogluconolactonase
VHGIRWTLGWSWMLLAATSCSDAAVGAATDASGDAPGDWTSADPRDEASVPDAAVNDARDAPETSTDALAEEGSVGDVDAAPPAATRVLYVGRGDGRISIFTLDPATGALAASGGIAAGDYPSFLAFDVRHLRLFAVLEATNKVAAFSIAKGSGALTKLNEVSSAGGPTHVSVDATGQYVMVANYGGGTASVFRVNADGSLGVQTDTRTPGANTHQILTDPSNGFVFTPNKGSDTVSQYVFDATRGTLTANAAPRLTLPSGSGPRHLAFHPDGKHAYLIDESNSTMTALSYDSGKGTLASVQTISLLPSGADPTTNTGAEVQIAPSGKYVYGSNRGHDSIVIYSVDSATGLLKLVGHEPTGGKTPRHFSLDDTGTLLVVSNQASSNVVTFRVDTAKGTLTRLATTAITSPAYFAAIALIPR